MQATAGQWMFKVGQCGGENWRRLRVLDYLAKVITGVKFTDGIETSARNQVAAGLAILNSQI